MKKVLAFLLMVVMATALFTGCSNPVYDDFENFMNVEMVEVNADYEKITAEVGTWESLESDAELAKSLKEVLIPLVNGSLEKLNAITPETDEVKEVKAKYVKVMEAYKAGFESYLAACETQDEAKISEAETKLNEGVELLNEYNAALEELAAEVGAEIEY